MLEKKPYYAFSSAIFFLRNYAKLMLLSENYVLCHQNFKIKITSSLTQSILTLMTIHVVHLPVLQSLDCKYACAHLKMPNDKQMIAESTVSGF